MGINKKIRKKIEEELFENIDLNPNVGMYLTKLNKKLYCIHTEKKNNEYNSSFFANNVSNNLNNFLEKVAKMLLTKDHNGDGCFDYEKIVVPEYNTLNVLNRYLLSTEYCFILVECIKEADNIQIEPISFSSIDKGFIWNVCTEISRRGKGYMTKFLNHCIFILKNGLIKNNKLNSLSLFLLRINPEFEKIKGFYNDIGFTTDSEHHDKIIMKIEFNN